MTLLHVIVTAPCISTQISYLACIGQEDHNESLACGRYDTESLYL